MKEFENLKRKVVNESRKQQETGLSGLSTKKLKLLNKKLELLKQKKTALSATKEKPDN